MADRWHKLSESPTTSNAADGVAPLAAADLFREAPAPAAPPLDEKLRRQFGTSRRMVVLGFEKTRLKDRAVRVLLSLLDDQDVNGHAVAAIAKLGQESGRRALEDAVDDPRRWVRNAAKRGVITLEKLAEK